MQSKSNLTTVNAINSYIGNNQWQNCNQLHAIRISSYTYTGSMLSILNIDWHMLNIERKRSFIAFSYTIDYHIICS